MAEPFQQRVHHRQHRGKVRGPALQERDLRDVRLEAVGQAVFLRKSSLEIAPVSSGVMMGIGKLVRLRIAANRAYVKFRVADPDQRVVRRGLQLHDVLADPKLPLCDDVAMRIADVIIVRLVPLLRPSSRDRGDKAAPGTHRARLAM